MEEIENLEYYITLAPVFGVGLVMGLVNYLNLPEDESTQSKLKTALKTILTSSVLCLITFSLLTAADLPYLAKVGAAAAVGYFGLDKAIEYIQKIINLKGSKQK